MERSRVWRISGDSFFNLMQENFLPCLKDNFSFNNIHKIDVRNVNKCLRFKRVQLSRVDCRGDASIYQYRTEMHQFYKYVIEMTCSVRIGEYSGRVLFFRRFMDQAAGKKEETRKYPLKKLISVIYASALLLTINFVITLSQLLSSWIRRLFWQCYDEIHCQ